MKEVTGFKQSTFLELDNKINELIFKNGLKGEQNLFFSTTKNGGSVSLEQATIIAFNWAEITKTFMFTAIAGVGALATHLLNQKVPSPGALAVLQTAFAVISDDLNNTHPLFKKTAPAGHEGIHYAWWESSILAKLKSRTEIPLTLSPSTIQLTEKMRMLSNDIMGSAVQLRIVECIAIDIATAFLAMYGTVQFQDKLLFPDAESKAWIIAHVHAEHVHNAQVSDSLSGMAKIAQTQQEQQRMLEMVDDYCKAWALALNDFAHLISATKN